VIDDDYQDKFAEKYRIKSARLLNWNYSTPGYYFITICTLNQNKFLGKIIDEKIILSSRGTVVQEELLKTFKIRRNIILDEYIIMPNHIHLLIKVISQNSVETHCVRLNIKNNRLNIKNNRLNIKNNRLNIKNNRLNNIKTPNIYLLKRDAYNASLQKISIKSKEIIPNIIKLFKGSVSSRFKKQSIFFGWQSRFYDKIIRTEKEYVAIKQYIKNNPINWERDEYGP